MHLHINWIGNIKITWKCKCNRIELKVQFKSKLSYLWIHSCEATQLYLTDLKIKLSTKKSHIKERHHHSYIAIDKLKVLHIVKTLKTPFMRWDKLLFAKHIFLNAIQAIWSWLFVCIIMVIIFVLKMYLHNNLHKQLSSTKRRKRAEGDGGVIIRFMGFLVLLYYVHCPV